jgi:two-component system NarL family sensor kinase
MRTLLILICCLFSLNGISQDRSTNDSLIAILKTAKDDTNKANILIQLCRNNTDIDNKAVGVYAGELLKLSQKTNFGKGMADAHNFLGIVEDDKSNYSRALELYGIALKYARAAKLDRKVASIENNIGLIYWKIGDQQKALGYYYDALRVFERLGEKKFQANVLSNIGLIHSSLNAEHKALEFQRAALALRLQTKDDYGTASTYNNISKVFTELYKEDSAIYYTMEAIALQKKMDDKYGLGISYANLGMSYGIKKKNDSALFYLQKSAAIREQIEDKLGSIYSYHALAEMYHQAGKMDLALKHGERALAISQEIKSKERIATCSHVLSRIHEKTGNYKKAYDYLNTHATYLEEIFDTIKNKQAAELAVKYDVEKKDLMIQKDKADLKNKQAEIMNKSLALKQRNTQLSLLAILLLGTGLSSWLLFNRVKLRQEARLQQEIIRQQDMAARAIIEAEESERKRIAGDLHDGIGQLCSAIKMNLSGLGSRIAFSDKETALSYEKTIALSDQACKDVRSISHQMMPNILLKSGLSAAVRDFLDKIDARRLEVHLETFGLTEKLDNNTEIVLYRIIQEAVNNVIKHSGASKLYIQLNRDNEGITATIEDNGTGFDVNDKNKFNGIGLKNIAGRVEFLKGSVEFDSAPGRGTVVSVWIPGTNS